ncbi:LRR_6 domain-containing protein [Cephalotus follicularis]|uniref:LRR_6 domain-containing protein n=1 Tax=Cephalotus follicularis TaxID=3775 RepID=A0A1Q3DF17_CEPFO|nr:LRR_6 domain-containing protein [Cephalotus follicularis]
MGKKSFDLPQECWELIIKSLNDHHMETLSLVSHTLLSITNHLCHTLTISTQPIQFLPQLFHRFPNLNKLILPRFQPDLDSLLFQISQSNLNLQSLILYPQFTFPLRGIQQLGSKMTNLKELNCSGMQSLQCRDLCAIGNSFPFLQVLDISFTDSFDVNDDGIVDLSLKLKSLREINLSGNFLLTDESLVALSSNCLSLRKVVILDYFLSDEALVELCKFFHSLRSINLNSCYNLTNTSFFTLTRECSLLTEIKMERTKLGLELFVTGCMVGNTQIICQNLATNDNLSDDFIIKIGSICPNVQVLDVSHCSGITEEGIVETLKNFKGIRHLNMNHCNGIKGFNIDFDLPKLEVLEVEGSVMNDDALAAIGKKCCGLLCLHLQGCLNVTRRGVKHVVENCRALREINLKQCIIDGDLVAWMVSARPSLRHIIPLWGFVPTENLRGFFLRHGCLVG